MTVRSHIGVAPEPPRRFSVWRVVHHPGFALFAACGELDLTSVHLLEHRLAEDPQEKTILDLTDVDFLSVSALEVLLRAHERAALEDRELAMVVPVGHIHRVLQLTGLDGRLRLFTTLPDALAHRTMRTSRYAGESATG